MELLVLLWLGLSIAIGAIATGRGRNFFGWFLISLLVSPLIAGVLLAAAGPAQGMPTTHANNKPAWSCPFCAEPIQVEAKICPHCRSVVPSIDPQVLNHFPKTYGNYRYRLEQDGSVLLATPSGARRFKTWSEFWRAVN